MMIVIKAARAARACRALSVVVLLLVCVLPTPVRAQISPGPSPTVEGVPVYNLTDSNGVNLISGQVEFSLQDVGIGAEPHMLSHGVLIRESVGPNVGVDSFRGWAQREDIQLEEPCYNQHLYTVHIGSLADRLCGDSTTGNALQGNGSEIVLNTDGSFVYTTRDGAIYTFGTVVPNPANLPSAGLTRIQTPDDRVTVITYKVVTVTWTSSPLVRTQSVTRNDGLQLKYRYVSDTTPTTQSASGSWYQRISVTAINNVVDYCDPAADVCTFSRSWPTASYAWTSTGTLQGISTVTDMGGRVTRYTSANLANVGSRIVAIKPPASASADTIQISYCQLNEWYCLSRGVKTFTRDGQSWQYTAEEGQGGPITYVIYRYTSPTGRVMEATQGLGYPGPLLGVDSEKEPGGYFYFDSGSPANRMTRYAHGEGDRQDFTYDARGNVTQVVRTPVSGSPLPSVTTSANYDATCTNPVKCNRPNWVRDGRGNQTDYTYDPTHGGVLTQTLPANADGIRAQTRYSYTQRYARYKNASGAIVQAPTPIWVLAQSAYCRTSAASGAGCTVAGDEVVTTYDYGPTTGANNLFLRGVAVTAEGQTLRTCYGYDDLGNKVSETPPKAGLGSCP